MEIAVGCLKAFKPSPWICMRCRSLSTTLNRPAGHSHWATIKHDKSKNDAAKSKERQIISKEIVQTSKIHGPDPKTNPRLTAAIANAKRTGMTKATIENAIAQGQGVSTTGAALESLTIEARLPGSIAAVIECLTEQRARVLQDLRYIIKEAGGTITPTSYFFEKRGRIVFENQLSLTVDDCLDSAIDAGATDVDTDESGRLVVFTQPTETKKVADAFSNTTGLRIESLDIIWDPNKETAVSIDSEETAKELESALADIREEPSVQDIYVNCIRE